METFLQIIETTTHDPVNNLAIEEAIFENCITQKSPPTLRIWKNSPVVVLGRSQHVEEEVNVDYCRMNNIQILRRFTGGGAVYHDLGNINSSFFFPVSSIPTKPGIIEYLEFFRLILVSGLKSIGYDEISTEGHSNIFIRGKKISGAAASLRKGWFVFHATLLVNANLNHLENSLRARRKNPPSKRGSRYFPTHNLNEIFPFDFNEMIWRNTLVDKISSALKVELVIEKEDRVTIQEKILSKYDTSKWNFFANPS